MGFNSQMDFNRYMDGYMDSLAKKSSRENAPLFRKKQAADVRRDKAIELEEKELREVAEPKGEKEKKKSLLQKLMFFAGDPSKQEKEAKKELAKDTDIDYDEDFELEAAQLRQQRQNQPKPVQRQVGPISNGVPLSSLRQASQPQMRPEVRDVAQNYPYSPNSEKDVKYLIGLVSTLLNRMDSVKRNEFYRSSEYRIFESVKKKY